jgi:putative phosphoribosyl transferase
MRFRDRRDAGEQLAAEVLALDVLDPLVLGLPRGGVPVAAEVARALDAPLDVLVSRKVGAPHHPEFGIGAVAEGGARVADWPIIRQLGLSDADFDRLATEEEAEVDRRVERYRGGRPLPPLDGRTVVVVDDGLATGVTAEAALRSVRGRRAGRLVLAVPVGAADTADRLADVADDVLCINRPPDFQAVGRWYERFDQTTDDEVVDCLATAARHTG